MAIGELSKAAIGDRPILLKKAEDTLHAQRSIVNAGVNASLWPVDLLP